MTTERWADVNGYNGLYQVSSLGRVKGKAKIKSQQDNGKGYLIVQLSKNGKPKWHLTHRLVAQAFIPNPNNKATVNHKDRIRTNNCVENLEWATYAENNLHRCKHSVSPSAKPLYCVETGEIFKSSYDAARKTGGNQAGINRCANGIFSQSNGLHWRYLNNRKEICNV